MWQGNPIWNNQSLFFSMLSLPYMPRFLSNGVSLQNLHCGCIASKFLMELHDSGGVNCISCAKDLELHIVRTYTCITHWFMLQLC